jgi:hypothetical protein
MIMAFHTVLLFTGKGTLSRQPGDRMGTVTIGAHGWLPAFFFLQQPAMDGTPLDLFIGMTPPAHQRRPYQILCLGFKYAIVRSGRKIGMTTGAGQGIMHGCLKFVGVYVSDQ